MFERNTELHQIMSFIVETDKLKNVLRQTLLTDRSRQENSAEHSWHLALLAMLTNQYANEPKLNIAKVIQMLLVHDIVEIDAGDTFAYDAVRNLDKEVREQAAAERIFSLLPASRQAECYALWREFEEQLTPEAKYANALDRLHPVLLNVQSKGAAWMKHQVTEKQVLERLKVIEQGSAALWEYAQELVSYAVEQGYLEKGE